MAPRHFEQVLLASIKQFSESATERSLKEEPYKVVKISAPADPVAEHFKRERLAGFGNAVPVRSECVRCGAIFSGDLREGIIEQEKEHILSCAKK